MLDSAHELETGQRLAARSGIRRHASRDLSESIALLPLLDGADPSAGCYFVAARLTGRVVLIGLCEWNYLVRRILLLGLSRDEFLWWTRSSSCLGCSDPLLPLSCALSWRLRRAYRNSRSLAQSWTDACLVIYSVYLGGGRVGACADHGFSMGPAGICPSR